MNRKRRFRERFPAWNIIEYLLVRTAMALINFLPITISTWLMRRIGDVMFLFMPRRRRIAFENITIAFGDSKQGQEKTNLALESFRNLATCFMEFFRIPKFVKVSEKHVRFQGTEHLKRAFARGKGLILVMSHLGPWEYLAFLAHLKKIHSTILGRQIRNPYLYQYFRYLRKLVDLENSDKDLGLRGIFKELRQNHLVALAIDQWAGNEGLWADFFGTATSTTSLPARLAQKTGCALIPAYCLRVASGEYKIHIKPEVAIEEKGDKWVDKMTKRLNYLLEQEIRSYPQQWLWTHQRWKKRKV